MVTKAKQTKVDTNSILTEKMIELGSQEGKSEGVRIEAIDFFATQIKGGNSNSMPIDANSGVSELKLAVEKYSIPANKAYCDAQNAAAGYTAVSDKSRDTYATYFTTIGMIAVKHPDSVAAILAATSAYCKGKTKAELGGRNKLQVYYRTACRIRDSLFPVKKDGVTPTARAPSVAEMSAKKFVESALAETKTRATRKTPSEKASPEPKPDTLDTLKATLLECAGKLAANEEVPASVRKALLTVAKWK